jgi:hypothetical protein
MVHKFNGPYEILGSKEVYKNPWMQVWEDKVIRPDGKEGIFGVIDYVDGVAVVSLDEEMNIYLIKEFRYGCKQESLELPCGAIDAGETPLEGAKRELKEEVPGH